MLSPMPTACQRRAIACHRGVFHPPITPRALEARARDRFAEATLTVSRQRKAGNREEEGLHSRHVWANANSLRHTQSAHLAFNGVCTASLSWKPSFFSGTEG